VGRHPGRSPPSTRCARGTARRAETRARRWRATTRSVVFEDARPGRRPALTVDYGLLTPQGYKQAVVRAFRRAQPKIFGKNTVAQAWGPPTPSACRTSRRPSSTSRASSSSSPEGRHGADDVHAAAARRPAPAPPALDDRSAHGAGPRRPGIAAFFVRGAPWRRGRCPEPARAADHAASWWAPACPRPTGRPAPLPRPRSGRWARRSPRHRRGRAAAAPGLAEDSGRALGGADFPRAARAGGGPEPGAARGPPAGCWPSTSPRISSPSSGRAGPATGLPGARGQSLTEWNGPLDSCSWPRPPGP
jgi:hypothetical protein